ncbi:MAG: hypothetical protein KJZ86_12735 [Caldilineaceae bacterium]|nr:hypothetical protein [Caldilineaceae bacterium]HRJ42511.1 hypothetical protein [Caldilineaceae bacterium]
MSRSAPEPKNAQSKGETDPPALWRLIPVADFKPPAGAAPEAVRTGLADLWKRLAGRGHRESTTDGELELAPPSQELLDWAAPEPACPVEEITAPHSALAAWLGREESTAGVMALIDGPVANLSGVLPEWASQTGYGLIQPPSTAQILAGGREWLDALPLGQGQRLLLPALEGCFLRHHNGLELLRRLLDRLEQERPSLLFVCQSWAWRYLCQAAQIDGVCGPPLALAPFGSDELNRWLGQTTDDSSPYAFVFREAATGKTVLETADLEGTVDPNRSAFLTHLAARSRGNPRLAWHIWRRSLLTTRTEEVDDTARKAADDDPGYTIWVRPWEDISLPDLTGRASKEDGMVLYTLLLHGTLPRHLLAELLPLPPTRIIRSLQHLRQEGVAQRAGDIWSVAALGYPAARRWLQDEGYLVDEL